MNRAYLDTPVNFPPPHDPEGTRSSASPPFGTSLGRSGTRPYQMRREADGAGILARVSLIFLLTAMVTMVLLTGCASTDKNRLDERPTGVTPTPAAPLAAVVPSSPPTPVAPAHATTPISVIRINAGSTNNFTDSSGNVWLSDRGFDGGDIVVRPADTEIANTKDPELYRTEHWGMDSFSQPLPNGKYVVKLHFAETSPNVEGPSGRLFNFTVNGHEFRDFDVWAKAGGPRRAYIETVNVDVKDGKFEIEFEIVADSPEINAIEISPAP